MAVRLVEITFQDPVVGSQFSVEIIRPDLGDTDRFFYRWENSPIDNNADQPVLVAIASPTANQGETAGNDFMSRIVAAEPNFLNDYEFSGGGNGPNGFTVGIQITHPGWFFDPNPSSPPFAIVEYFEGDQGTTPPPSLSITPHIAGQQVTDQCTYCYLYEPLKIAITEGNVLAEKIYIDLEVIDTGDSSSTIEMIEEYGVYDINPGKPVSVDLMKMALQHHDANVLKYASVDQLILGWDSIVSKYRYKFLIRTDTTPIPIEVYKLPIIGGRAFEDFIGLVDHTNKLDEFSLLGINIEQEIKNYPTISATLNPSTDLDSRPNIVKNIQSIVGNDPCGGYIIWKSRLGGWLSWGFGIKTEKKKHKYSGNLEVGLFESDAIENGNPYIELDYTKIEYSYSISLKSLSLNSLQLKAVDSINSSQVVFFVRDIDGKLEAMRLGSASVPISNKSNGGDFSVSLKSISTSSQKLR